MESSGLLKKLIVKVCKNHFSIVAKKVEETSTIKSMPFSRFCQGQKCLPDEKRIAIIDPNALFLHYLMDGTNSRQLCKLLHPSRLHTMKSVP